MSARKIMVYLRPEQATRLRSLSARQGRSQSWYIWRGLTRHVLPAYGASDRAGSDPDEGGTTRLATSLPEETAAKLDEFCATTGRSKSWAIRVALDEYAFPTYDPECEVARAREVVP